MWAKGYGGPNNQETISVAVDSSGNVVVGGYSTEPIDVGCGTLPTAAGETPLLFKLSPTGDCIWSKAFTVTQVGMSNEVMGVAVSPSGDIYIAVTFYGAVDLGGGTLTSAGGSDVAVAKYDANGNYQWAKQFGDASDQTVSAIALDAAANVIVGGGFVGTVNFGGGTLTSGGGQDAFVAKLTSAGAYVWAKGYGDSGAQLVFDVAVDPSGDVLVIGANTSALNLGCGAVTSAGPVNAFLAKLSGTGTCVWSKGYGTSGGAFGYGVASDASGNVLAAGSFGTSIDLGGGSVASQGGNDAWVVKLSPTGGYLWAQTPGGAGTQNALSVVTDAAGDVLITGALNGSATFGSTLLTSAGGADIYVAKYDPAGNALWAKSYGDASDQQGRTATFDAMGNAIVGGVTGGPVDFGMGPVAGFGLEDAWVLKLSP